MNYKEEPKMQFTQWDSMSTRISNKKIKLVKNGNNSLKVESSGKYGFIIFPLIILISIVATLIGTDYVLEFGFKNYIGLTFFLAIVGVAMYLIHKFSFQPSIFDFDNKIYHYGNHQELNLNDIKGIQLLTHHHAVTGNYRIRFEINLVKSDGDRLHLYNNAKYQLILKQADIISKNLNVEIWDATND